MNIISRIALGSAIAVLAVGIWTFAPVTLALPPADVGALPSATPPAGMSVSLLLTGTYDTPEALAYRGGAWRQTRHFGSAVVLIRHPKGNLLVDAGFGRRVDEHMQLIPSIQRSPHHKQASVIDQLAKGGLATTSIAGIIPTHAHWDHVSGIDDLRGVPVMVSETGKTWIDSAAKGTEVMNSLRGVRYQPYRFEDGPYLGFARSHDVWHDGSVVIVPAAGHTPDSVIVFVTLPSASRYALVGDLVWQTEGLTLPAEKPWMMRRLIGEDDDVVHEDIARIRAAMARYPQIHAIPAHDVAALLQIPRFPAAAN